MIDLGRGVHVRYGCQEAEPKLADLFRIAELWIEPIEHERGADAEDEREQYAYREDVGPRVRNRQRCRVGDIEHARFSHGALLGHVRIVELALERRVEIFFRLHVAAES